MAMHRLAAGLPLALALAAGACSGSGSGETRAKVAGDGDGGTSAAMAAPVDVEVRPVGRASLDEFAWRRGPGREAFARALAAEKKGDMAGVAREAGAALAADPGHLEAAWLVAIAKANLGELDGVLEPLAIAASGDWAKWGERSLVLPALEAFRQTPQGQGWVRAAEQYRSAMADALAGSVVVVARSAAPRIPRPGGDGVEKVEQRAELYAVGAGAGARWVRLTRTGGTVAGALPAAGRAMVAYAAYDEIAHGHGGDAYVRELRIGAVDLATGRTGREIALRDVHEVMVGWQVRGSEATLVARVVPARVAGAAAEPARVFAIDWRQGQKRGTDLPAPRDGLRIRALSAERRRLPVAGVTADWDDAGTASALRIDKSKKVVAPGGAMIDGHSVVWSPDGARLAFATAAEDPCGDAAAKQVSVHVVDAASGRSRVVGKGAGVPSPIWLDAARLAYVDGDGVRVVDAASGKEVARLAGGGGVVTGALGESRACADESAPPPFTYAPPSGEPDEGADEPAEEPPEADGPP